MFLFIFLWHPEGPSVIQLYRSFWGILAASLVKSGGKMCFSARPGVVTFAYSIPVWYDRARFMQQQGF
jgi:hypothetical protein